MPNGDLSKLVEKELEKRGNYTDLEAGLLSGMKKKSQAKPQRKPSQDKLETVDAKGPLRNPCIRHCCNFVTSSALRWMIIVGVLVGAVFVYGKAVERGWAPDTGLRNNRHVQGLVNHANRLVEFSLGLGNSTTAESETSGEAEPHGKDPSVEHGIDEASQEDVENEDTQKTEESNKVAEDVTHATGVDAKTTVTADHAPLTGLDNLFEEKEKEVEHTADPFEDDAVKSSGVESTTAEEKTGSGIAGSDDSDEEAAKVVVDSAKVEGKIEDEASIRPVVPHKAKTAEDGATGDEEDAEAEEEKRLVMKKVKKGKTVEEEGEIESEDEEDAEAEEEKKIVEKSVKKGKTVEEEEEDAEAEEEEKVVEKSVKKGKTVVEEEEDAEAEEEEKVVEKSVKKGKTVEEEEEDVEAEEEKKVVGKSVKKGKTVEEEEEEDAEAEEEEKVVEKKVKKGKVEEAGDSNAVEAKASKAKVQSRKVVKVAKASEADEAEEDEAEEGEEVVPKSAVKSNAKRNAVLEADEEEEEEESEEDKPSAVETTTAVKKSSKVEKHSARHVPADSRRPGRLAAEHGK